MKKFTLALMALLSISCMVKAQQYVSTEPANRNVIIEEFTGRGCQYCPDGHRIANEIMANNPNRVWAINVHAGGYAMTSYPNFNTTDGNTIHGGFTISGYPTGVVNRSTAAGQNRGAWSGLANTQLNQQAECNVAGVARINLDTRVATITVEVYYTGNSSVSENYLTVAMLQDSILGSQSGSSYNPSQIVNGTYCHMHVLRDVITPNAWGEAISPTTQGTLITKTYEYQIPESIGNPNGVAVNLDHIFFLAWVSERYQGTPTRPILTACKLVRSTVTDQPIYPMISELHQQEVAQCSHTKGFSFMLTNIGTETLTSVKCHATIAGSSKDFEWTGELPSEGVTDVVFDMDIPNGTYSGTLAITEANGTPFESTLAFNAECDDWPEVIETNDFTDIRIYIVQDQFGEQITWNLINSSGEIIAEGGPYQHLVGSNATQINVAHITDMPTNECYLFRIYDSNEDGICCSHGEGYYYFKDSNGNRFIEGDGNYGAMAKELFSIHKSGYGVDETETSNIIVYPNPANSKIFVEGENIGTVEVYNSLGQKVATVDGSENTTVDVASFENGIYLVRVITGDDIITTKKITIIH